MADHKYNIGELVEFVNSRVAMDSKNTRCQIIRHLATDGDDPQYRVTCPAEGFERVVRESQLRSSMP
jgi:hypothetical protein